MEFEEKKLLDGIVQSPSMVLTRKQAEELRLNPVGNFYPKPPGGACELGSYDEGDRCRMGNMSSGPKLHKCPPSWIEVGSKCVNKLTRTVLDRFY